MKKTNRALQFALPLFLFAILPSANAQNFEGLSPEEKGLAITRELDKRDTGFINSTAAMTMTLRTKSGQEVVRRIRNKTLEGKGDGDKSMSIFDEPADVKGTVSLTYSHGLKPDDQWLFLPALARVKRINSKNKSGPFMGSEFAYEDISSQEVEKYTYKYLRDEKLGDTNTFVVERYPAYKYSGYTRQITWIDQQRFIILKVDYYDRKDSLLKTLEFKDYKQYLDQFWRANTMHMENHQTGKNTTLEWADYKFRVDLIDRDFDQSALKRVR